MQIDTRPIELALAAKAFKHFLSSWVVVGDPPPAGRGYTRYQMWPHLEELASYLPTTPRLVWLKSRQIAASWTMAAYAVHTARFRDGATVLLYSKGEAEAQELLRKCLVVWEHLPDWVRIPEGQRNLTEIVLSNGSRILSMPSTAHAGRSYTATLVIYDEADFHQYLSESYGAVEPLVRDTGGQLFLVSTPNPDSVVSTFKLLYREAESRGYRRVYHSWKVRPGRTQADYDRAYAAAPDKSRFRKEWSNSDVEALAPATEQMFFDEAALTELLGYTTEPRETIEGMVQIWRKPAVAGRYVIGGDVAWGEKGAYSCVVVADYATLDQVAEIHSRPALDELAAMTVKMGTLYNRAYASIEDNGEGHKVVEMMVKLGYGPRMFKRQVGRETKYGSLVTGGPSGTRPMLLQDLAEAVRTLQMRPRCRDGVGEMMSFIRDEKGHPVPSQGAKADHVFAWAHAVEARGQAHFPTVERSGHEVGATNPLGRVKA